VKGYSLCCYRISARIISDERAQNQLKNGFLRESGKKLFKVSLLGVAMYRNVLSPTSVRRAENRCAPAANSQLLKKDAPAEKPMHR
jgi:hypothetical protein